MAFKLKSSGLPFKELGSSPFKQPYDRSFKEVLKNPDPYSPKGGNWSPPASEYVSEYELSGTKGSDKQLKLDKAKKVAKKSGQRVVVDPKTKKATLKTTWLKKLKRIVKHPTVKKTAGKAIKLGLKSANLIGGALTAIEVGSKAKHAIKGLKERTKKETETGYSNPGVPKM